MPLRPLLIALLSMGAAAFAQVPVAPPKPLTRNVEPGLEQAVKWKWQTAPSSASAWGEANSVTPDTESLPEPTAAPVATATPMLGGTYEVKSGDRLALIAKRHGITVVQLKGFNNLTTDLIRVGQILNIPTREQAIAIAPMPVERKPARIAEAPADPTEILALQIFLDRANFSTGPIDGKASSVLDRVATLYLTAHPEIPSLDALKQKAAAAGDLYTTYTLRPQDFKFIVPPKAQRYEAPAAAGAPPRPKSTAAFEDLVAAPMLAYKGPWEFVAERFHSSESFLRSINDEIATVPTVGTTLRVPRVHPFAIESALAPPLQPAPNPAEPAVAAIEDLSLLQISRGARLVAVMPITSARPGLRGRGSWVILNAIARPTLTTIKEPTAAATPPPPLYGAAALQPTPAPTPTPAPETLNDGPNNPVGIIWINLAKSDAPTTPLIYGLHGTSVPDQVHQMDSIGGFRMANWNIARAVRFLPDGTPLQWIAADATFPIAPATPSAPPLPSSPSSL